MYFIGHTRFSVYQHGSHAWHLSQISEQEYRNQLFSDERLKIRFEIFFNKAVPIYSEMAKEYFYKHIIQYSYLLPERWKNELKERARIYDFIVLSETGPDRYELPFLDILQGQPSGTFVYFRVDDDDILSRKYLAALSIYAKTPYQGLIVSFGSGLIALYEDGCFTDFRVSYERFGSQGQAYIGLYDASKKQCRLPQGGNHTIVDRFSPTVVDSREPMFIYTFHNSQDQHSKLDENTENKLSRIMNRHRKIQSSLPYAASFPTVVRDMDYMLNAGENSETVVILEATHLDSEKISIDVSSQHRGKQFIVDYSMTENPMGENKNSMILPRELTLSFEFEDEQSKIKGLNFSDVVGWYSYISFQNGIGHGRIRFVLDISSSIKGIYLQKWKSKALIITINFLKVAVISSNESKISLKELSSSNPSQQNFLQVNKEQNLNSIIQRKNNPSIQTNTLLVPDSSRPTVENNREETSLDASPDGEKNKYSQLKETQHSNSIHENIKISNEKKFNSTDDKKNKKFNENNFI